MHVRDWGLLIDAHNARHSEIGLWCLQDSGDMQVRDCHLRLL